jgi:hypothetical protein
LEDTGVVQTVLRSDHLAGRVQAVDARDAAEYITALPKAEHDAADWQVARETLLLARRDGDASAATESRQSLSGDSLGNAAL